MTEAVHAEWTKLRTVAGTWWLLLGLVVLTVGLSAATSAAVSCSSAGCHQDPVKISLTGTTLGQAIVAILAVTAIGGEYATGMIRTTLVAVPRRSTALAAKAVTLGAVVLIVGLPTMLGSVLMARLLLSRSGFTVAHGFGAVSLTDGSTLRATVGSVLYLALIGLFSLGITTVVRDPAVATGVVLGLLYLSPILVHLVADPHLQRHLEQITPMSAGLAIQNTTNLQGLPISPWSGLGVLAAWSGAALLAGATALRLRDA